MTITAILMILGFLSLATLLFLAKGRVRPATSLAVLRTQVLPLDLEAFRNLVDCQDDEFLRRSLEPAQFRAIQRARVFASIEYILCASRNAAILHQFGETARHSSNPSVVEAGTKLVNTAIRFRLNALQAVLRLYLVILMRGTSIQRCRIAEGYERMTTLVALLGCLQFEARSPHATTAPQLSR